MNKQQEVEKLAELVDKISKAIADAELFADHHDLNFYMPNAEYGMGGTYDGKEGKWRPSSQSC